MIATGNKPRSWIYSIGNFGLSILLFAVGLAAYAAASHYRHLENPDDKIMPTLYQIGDAFYRSAFVPDKNGVYQLWTDTAATGTRFAWSIAFLFGAVLIGLHMSVIPFLRTALLRFVLFFDKIPALCLLPILFIVFGLDETSKIALVVIGLAPTVMLDTFNLSEAIPREQMTKAATFEASRFEVAWCIVRPQIWPSVLNGIRLNLKSVMLFLITGEALAASSGLGYRIFVVRRYMAMDKIIAYAIWMSLLLFLIDLGIRVWTKKVYPWFNK